MHADLWKTLKFLESFSFQGYATTVYENRERIKLLPRIFYYLRMATNF